MDVHLWNYTTVVQLTLGRSTIAHFIHNVCVILWKRLGQCLNVPISKEEWKQIANDFEKRANFPHCVGAIDGKHIRITKPTDSGSLYYNYKHFFSILLLGVCDANYKFIFVDVGAYGKSCDSAVFKDTQFYAKLMNNSLELPDASPLSGNLLHISPYTLVGDEAFGLHEHLMRPYGGILDHKKKIFNYRLTRARRFIECTFGILSNKWRIFHRPLNVRIDFAVDIIKAACVLHNFVRDRDGFQYDDTLHVTGFENVVRSDMSRNSEGRTALSVRDKLAEYFVIDDPLPWQNDYI